MAETQGKFFKMEDRCQTALPTCETGGIPGTYEMAMALVRTGQFSGTARIDCRFKNNAWTRLFNDQIRVAAFASVAAAGGNDTGAVDLATGSIYAVNREDPLEIVCGCGVSASTPEGGLPTLEPPPEKICGEGLTYGEADGKDGEFAACAR